MNGPIEYAGTWKALRYQWKKMIGGSPLLSRPEKYLAMRLCDDFANSKTGLLWPKTAKIADRLGVDVRTVQRHLRALKDRCWVQDVRIKGKRGVMQLTFPPGVTISVGGDKIAALNASKMSSNRDKNVVSYIEPRKEPREQTVGCVLIGRDDNSTIERWIDWISENTKFDPEVVLRRVATSDGYYLPCRFPHESSHENRLYETYISEAMEGVG